MTLRFAKTDLRRAIQGLKDLGEDTIDTSSALAILSGHVSVLCALRLTVMLERVKAIKAITF